MARSHHRKKHKEHLRQFKHSQETTTDIPRGKTAAIWVFSIAGAVLGFAVAYFATSGAVLWMVAGLIAGGLAGYWIGRRIDGDKAK